VRPQFRIWWFRFTKIAITVEVIHNYLLSAAREMNRNLIRTSYSTIIYEIHDFGLGIYDRQCRMLAEAPGLAIFIP